MKSTSLRMLSSRNKGQLRTECKERRDFNYNTKEHSSKEKIGRLQGKIPSSKYDIYIYENLSESEGTQKNKSRRITSDDFDFDF